MGSRRPTRMFPRSWQTAGMAARIMADEVKRSVTVEGSALILTHSSLGFKRIACTLGTISMGASLLKLSPLYNGWEKGVNAAARRWRKGDWRRGADSNRRIKVLQTSPLAPW